MKNIGLSNYAALITNDFNDLLTTYINPIPEFWNVHVLTPLYESPYHNGLTFSILFQLQGELLNYGLGRSVRFTDFMELKYQGNDILLIKSDGSSLLYKYDKTLFDQSYNIGIYINKETNSTLSAIDDRYGYRWRIHTHDNDSYEFQPNGSKILL